MFEIRREETVFLVESAFPLHEPEGPHGTHHTQHVNVRRSKRKATNSSICFAQPCVSVAVHRSPKHLSGETVLTETGFYRLPERTESNQH